MHGILGNGSWRSYCCLGHYGAVGVLQVTDDDIAVTVEDIPTLMGLVMELVEVIIHNQEEVEVVHA